MTVLRFKSSSRRESEPPDRRRLRVADLLDKEPVPPQPEAGSKVYYRLMDRLREKDREHLEQVEKVLKVFSVPPVSVHDGELPAA